MERIIPEIFLDADKKDNEYLFELKKLIEDRTEIQNKIDLVSHSLNDKLITLFKEYSCKEGDIIEGGNKKEAKSGKIYYQQYKITKIEIGYLLNMPTFKLFGNKISKTGIISNKESYINNPRIKWTYEFKNF